MDWNIVLICLSALIAVNIYMQGRKDLLRMNLDADATARQRFLEETAKNAKAFADSMPMLHVGPGGIEG